MNGYKVFDTGAHPELCQETCKLLERDLAQIQLLEFSNENVANIIGEDIRGSDSFVISTQAPPVQKNIQVMLRVVRNLRANSEGKVRVIFGYFPEIRSDKKDQPRISVGARDMADQITNAGAHGVIIFDPHFPQIIGFFDPLKTRVEIVTAKSVFLNRIVEDPVFNRENTCVVAPDLGSAKLAGSFATRLHVDLAFVDKRRIGNIEKVVPVAVIGNVKGKHCKVPDDEVCGGGTFIEVAKFLLDNGAASIEGFMTHGVLTKMSFLEEIKSIPEIIALHVTNTIPVPQEKRQITDKLKVHTVAHIVAGLIRSIHERKSVHGPEGLLRGLYCSEVRK